MKWIAIGYIKCCPGHQLWTRFNLLSFIASFPVWHYAHILPNKQGMLFSKNISLDVKGNPNLKIFKIICRLNISHYRGKSLIATSKGILITFFVCFYKATLHTLPYISSSFARFITNVLLISSCLLLFLIP